MEQPSPVPDTPYHRLGGAPVFEAIANRFYDLMVSDPAYAELRAMHAADLARCGPRCRSSSPDGQEARATGSRRTPAAAW
ncbi:hypothetical protein GCM10017612_23130 [Novosphingobium resinovorum]|nr:hypothetical protein GCM10017612_23130 [Novosphingobium resinovorum]